MKAFGSVVEFTRQRNADIMRVFRQKFAAARGLPLSEIYRQVAESPSSRFWVSEDRAAIVVAAMQAGRHIPLSTPGKRAMFDEIYRRYLLLRADHPDKSVIELVTVIVNQPAPSFYFTPGSIRVFINRIINGYYDSPAYRRAPEGE